MNKVNKVAVKDITEGAIYVAAYALLALLTRYLITGVDSMIYYIYPLPMAILSARKKFSISLIVALASIAISFLFGNTLYVLILMMPNILGGLIMGTCLKSTKLQILTYIAIYVIFLVSSYLSIWLFEKINNVGYWEDISSFASNLFQKVSDIDSATIEKIVTAVCTVVIIIDALVKEVLNLVIFFILINRLNLAKEVKLKFKIGLKYHFLIALTFIAMSIVMYLSLASFIMSDLKIYEIVFVSSITIVFVLGLYLIYQVMMFIRLNAPKLKFGWFVLIVLTLMIFFPLTCLFGLVLNFINYNFIKTAIK